MEEELILRTNQTFEGEEGGLTVTVINTLVACTSILGLLSNAIIIYIVARNKRMQTRTNVYLANWALVYSIWIITECLLPRFFLAYHAESRMILYISSNACPAACLLISILLNTAKSARLMCCLIYSFLITFFTTAVITTYLFSKFTILVFAMLCLIVIALLLACVVFDLKITCGRNNDKTSDWHVRLCFLRMQYGCMFGMSLVFLLDAFEGSVLTVELLLCTLPILSCVILAFLYQVDSKIRICIEELVMFKSSTVGEEINYMNYDTNSI